MKYRVLAGGVLGMVLMASLAAIDCGGDDTAPPAAGGSAGTGGTAAAGSAGTGGGMSGQGGTGGGVSGAAGQGGGGTAGQGGGDAGPKADASDATAALVPFQSVVDILTAQCTGCHKSNDGSVTGLIDLQTATGLYARLTSPLPSGQEGQCGFPDAGTDDGGADGGDGAVSNRSAVVPGDLTSSLLYLKILGTQPAGCGSRMPRIKVVAEDGGVSTVGCDVADGGAGGNCLTSEQANTIRDWIAQGAHEFPADK